MEEDDGEEERIRYWIEAMRCVLNCQLSLYFSCNLLFHYFQREEPKSLMSAQGLKPLPQQ